MDSGILANLPPGWKRYQNQRGRIQYDSPPPITHIRSISQLLRYQRQGKFKELDVESVSFLVKKNKTKKNLVILPRSEIQSVQVDDVPLERAPEHSQAEADHEAFDEDDYDFSLSLPSTLHQIAASSFFTIEEPAATVAPSAPAAPAEPAAPASPSDKTGSRARKVVNDLNKISSAVKLLTLDETKTVDHKIELKAAAKLLSDARIQVNFQTNLDDLKSTQIES